MDFWVSEGKSYWESLYLVDRLHSVSVLSHATKALVVAFLDNTLPEPHCSPQVSSSHLGCFISGTRIRAWFREIHSIYGDEH